MNSDIMLPQTKRNWELTDILKVKRHTQYNTGQPLSFYTISIDFHVSKRQNNQNQLEALSYSFETHSASYLIFSLLEEKISTCKTIETSKEVKLTSPIGSFIKTDYNAEQQIEISTCSKLIIGLETVNSCNEQTHFESYTISLSNEEQNITELDLTTLNFLSLYASLSLEFIPTDCSMILRVETVLDESTFRKFFNHFYQLRWNMLTPTPLVSELSTSEAPPVFFQD